MKKTLLVLSLLVLFFLISAKNFLASNLSACHEGNLLEEGHRAYELLNSISPVEGIKICTLERGSKSYVAVNSFNGVWLILMSTHTLTFSDNALKGAFAHELGHIHVNFGQIWRSNEERELGDQEADAFAIRLVGPEALLETYIAHTGDEELAKRRVKRALNLFPE